MAFNGTVLTTKGRNLQAKAQTGVQLNFTKVKIGDGTLGAGQSLEALNDLINPKMTLNIQGLAVLGDGTSRIRAVITNTGLATGFFVREIGVFAQDPDLGEILYCVANAGAECDYLPAEGSVSVEQTLDIVTAVGNATNVTAVINETIVLATKADLTSHNNDPQAHGLLTALHLWQPNKAYAVGDICYSGKSDVASYKRFECVQGGTSGTTEPTWPAVGQTVTDRTVVWKVSDIRDARDAASVGGKTPGTGANNVLVLDANGKVPQENLPPIPSGIPIGSVIPWTTTTIPDGWLECNGQAVSRTDFSELFAKIGTTFGSGDGSTTFNVPDLRGEFIRGWDNGRGVDSGRAFGSFQADAFQGHWHEIYFEYDQADGRDYHKPLINGNKYSRDYSYDWVRNPISDGVNGEPRTSSETRPRNVALMFIIKAKDVAGSDPAVQGANADTLDGFHASAFALTGHIHTDSSTIKPALNASGDAPIYACRAWVNFDGTTTPTIRASGNVSSITKNGTGDYTVNFTTPMPHANYSATANYTNTNTAQATENDGQAIPWNYQANFVCIFVSHGSGSAIDGKVVSVSIHC